jgi:hypothetical protein
MSDKIRSLPLKPTYKNSKVDLNHLGPILHSKQSRDGVRRAIIRGALGSLSCLVIEKSESELARNTRCRN